MQTFIAFIKIRFMIASILNAACNNKLFYIIGELNKNTLMDIHDQDAIIKEGLKIKTWQSKFEIGHQRIDFEHRIFLDLVNNIVEHLQQNKSRDTIIRLILELEKYAIFHFVSEENIMIEMNFPELEEHRSLHHNLLDELSNKKIEFELGNNEFEDFVEFLYNWFIQHTLQEDKKVAQFAVMIEKKAEN